MSNVLVKIAALKPHIYVDDTIEALIYRFEDLKWINQTIHHGSSIESIYTEAHNTLMKTIQEVNVSEGYLLVELESVGLKAFRLEGETKNVFKILYPMPQPLHKIAVYKRSNGEYVKIHEAVFSSEHWVYDGYITVKNAEWDLIVMETSLYRKVISKKEYEEPVLTIKTEAKRRKRRRRSRRKEKKRKKRSKMKRGRRIV